MRALGCILRVGVADALSAYFYRFRRAERPRIKFEADDDDSAMGNACQQSLNFDMTIELCDGDRQLARITPMTARLYAPDRGDPVLGTA
jgi:hypothetical protein